MSSIYKTNNKGPSIDPLVRKSFKYNGYINALYGGYKKVISALPQRVIYEDVLSNILPAISFETLRQNF